MTRILLLGKYGQLGWELQRALATMGEITALDYPEIDLVHPEQLRPIIQKAKPNIIVNATAYTAVDKAESEPDIAHAVNSRAVRVMAEEARGLGATLVHYSTDYVFDGIQGSAYTENDQTNPLGVYGQSKLAGEQAIQETGGIFLILRTSWVYSMRRDSFVSKVLEWSRRQTTMRVVRDQVSNPTWCRMLAEMTSQMLVMAGEHNSAWLGERSGLYHLAGWGYASRFEWAQAILANDPKREEQAIQELLPALTSEFPTPAKRPLFSALNCNRFEDTFGLKLPAWQDALRLAMES
jgi:dTDP-4-dehydrorhamnose reductase